MDYRPRKRWNSEHSIQMPFVNYFEMVHHFIEDVYDFEEQNKDFELTRYGKFLEKNGLEWGIKQNEEIFDYFPHCIINSYMWLQ